MFWGSLIALGNNNEASLHHFFWKPTFNSKKFCSQRKQIDHFDGREVKSRTSGKNAGSRHGFYNVLFKTLNASVGKHQFSAHSYRKKAMGG